MEEDSETGTGIMVVVIGMEWDWVPWYHVLRRICYTNANDRWGWRIGGEM